MVPTVTQQLSAIRHTVAKTIMPAIGADEGFAREQAGLVLASLDWAIDVVEAQDAYERVEHAEYRDALDRLAASGDDATRASARSVLDATSQPPSDLATLREQTLALKRETERAFRACTSDPSGASAAPARDVVSAIARRQVERELAWARMTGFPKGVERSVAEVVADGGARRPGSSTG